MNTWDWFMSGLSNPLQALNTFENTVGKSVDQVIRDYTKPVTDIVNPIIEAVPFAKQALQSGVSWNNATSPAPGGVPSVGQINEGAGQYARDNSATDFVVTPPVPTTALSNPLDPSAQYPYVNSMPTSQNPASTGEWADPSKQPSPYGTPSTHPSRYYDPANPVSSGAPAAPGAPSGGDMVTVPSAGSGAPAPNGGGGIPWKDVLAAGAIAAPAISQVIGGGSMAEQQAQAARDAAQLQREQFDKVIAEQTRQYDQTREDQRAWREAGVGALGKLNTFGTDNPDFDMSKFEADPGYSFRLSEGMKALQNSAAARGGLISGNAMKGISNYGQESASQEYNNAYNRYNQNRTFGLNRLQSLAGVGQTANQNVQQAGQNYATNVGNAYIGQGNAGAEGITGAANARASGYVNGVNALNGAVNNYFNYNKMMQGQDSVNALKSGGY
jgi:hypothetical protein